MPDLYSLGRGARKEGDSGEFAARQARAGQKRREVGIFGIGVGERVGFGPRVLSSFRFLPLFVLSSKKNYKISKIQTTFSAII